MTHQQQRRLITMLLIQYRRSCTTLIRNNPKRDTIQEFYPENCWARCSIDRAAALSTKLMTMNNQRRRQAAALIVLSMQNDATNMATRYVWLKWNKVAQHYFFRFFLSYFRMQTMRDTYNISFVPSTQMNEWWKSCAHFALRFVFLCFLFHLH